jgi:hypothetical protein
MGHFVVGLPVQTVGHLMAQQLLVQDEAYFVKREDLASEKPKLPNDSRLCNERTIKWTQIRWGERHLVQQLVNNRGMKLQD